MKAYEWHSLQTTYEAFYLARQDMQIIPKPHLNEWLQETEVTTFFIFLF